MSRRSPKVPQKIIDLNYLLTGKPSWEEVVWFFKNEEFGEEAYLVEAIEKFLLTDDQRKWIMDERLSIEKMLNGRYAGEGRQYDSVKSIFKEWNQKLGFKRFNEN